MAHSVNGAPLAFCSRQLTSCYHTQSCRRCCLCTLALLCLHRGSARARVCGDEQTLPLLEHNTISWAPMGHLRCASIHAAKAPLSHAGCPVEGRCAPQGAFSCPSSLSLEALQTELQMGFKLDHGKMNFCAQSC